MDIEKEVVDIIVEQLGVEANQVTKEKKIVEDLNVDFHTYTLPNDHEMVQRASKVLENIDLTPNLGPTGGGTDANVFNRRGIPSVVVGMSTNLMHTNREYVDIPDLINTARFCQALLVSR